MPSNANFVTQALKASERHRDNVAVQVLAESLNTAVQAARVAARNHTAAFVGYRCGAEGEDGFSPLYDLNADLLQGPIKEMGAIHRVGVITEMLVAVLNAHGEDLPM